MEYLNLYQNNMDFISIKYDANLSLIHLFFYLKKYFKFLNYLIPNSIILRIHFPLQHLRY